MNANDFDVVIVGGSYSGLAAAMALGRALRRVLVIDSGRPCNAQTPKSHNFLTQDGRPPAEIAALARQQVEAYSTVEFRSDYVTTGMRTDDGFVVETEAGEAFSARQLIFATGIRDRMPDIDGFAECWGISVLHCPYCHGYEVKSQPTGILANGDAGFEFAGLILNWTKELVLFTNGASSLSSDQARVLGAHGIQIVEAEIQRIEHHNGHLRVIHFKDGSSFAGISALYARLPFEQHSSLPAALGCELTDQGYIKVDAMQRTTVDGVFACGDNVTNMRTVANAVAMGTTAGMMANKALSLDEFLAVGDVDI